MGPTYEGVQHRIDPELTNEFEPLFKGGKPGRRRAAFDDLCRIRPEREDNTRDRQDGGSVYGVANEFTVATVYPVEYPDSDDGRRPVRWYCLYVIPGQHDSDLAITLPAGLVQPTRSDDGHRYGPNRRLEIGDY